MNILNNKGAAAIEFAIVLPVLLTILFGIVEFGLIMYNKAMITNASREGARQAALYREDASGTPYSLTCGEITSVINTYTDGHLVTFGSATGVKPPVYDPSSCAPVPGSPLSITVNYAYDYLVLPNFAGLGATLDLSATTVMYKE